MKVMDGYMEPLDTKFDEGYDSSSWTNSTRLNSNSSPNDISSDSLDLTGNDIWNEANGAGPKKPKKKRKRPYYIPVNKLPRILKRDIRRDYPIMYVNVLNSLDAGLINNFLEQFGCSSLSFSRCLPYASRHNFPVTRSINGIPGIALGLHEEISSFPDFVLQIQSVKIYQKEHVAGCKIIIQSLMKGTMLIDGELLAKAAAAIKAQQATKKRSTNNSSSNKKKKEIAPQMPDITSITTFTSSSSALLQVPTAVIEGLSTSFNQLMSLYTGEVPKIVPISHKLVTQTTFSVDEDFKIYHIDVIDEFVPV